MTVFVLKLIALSCMIIDHLGGVFPQYFPFAFRIIGRVAFPIYVFLIAEGCRHTRSMPKYLVRLGLFALLSEIPFDLAFNQASYGPLQIDFLKNTNVFYTLFLGALCVYALQKLREIKVPFSVPFPALWSLIPLSAALWLAEWLGTDYGAFGVAFIFCLYCVPKKIPRLAVMALFCCYAYYEVLLGGLKQLLGLSFGDNFYEFYFNANNIALWLACLFSVLLVALSNGKRGPSLKWFFYCAYPLHLLLFAGIWLLFVKPGL